MSMLVLHHDPSVLRDIPGAARFLTALVLVKGPVLLRGGVRGLPDAWYAGVQQRITTQGTVLVETDAVACTVTVIADIKPAPSDWAEACALLAQLGAEPLGEPTFDGEFDRWTVPTKVPSIVA